MLRPSLTAMLLTANALAVASGAKTSASSSALAGSMARRHLLGPQPPSCSLQNGVDFLGNDIANVEAPAASDCCAKCSAQAGCNAFTWTNFNGGTCWLKTGKGTNVVANAGAQSAEMVVPAPAPVPAPKPNAAPASCSIESGVDYVANDIANVAAPAPTDCCVLCSALSACGAFTWTNWNGGTCWLKSGKGETTANAGAYSSVVAKTSGASATPATTTAAPTPNAGSPMCPNVEQNTDFTGADITNVPGSGAPDCCAKCARQAGCGAFTWTNYNGGTCWLKSERGTAKALPGGVSAVMTASTAATTNSPAPAATTAAPTGSACPVVEENMDYPGNDVANVPGTGATECCAKCRARADCRAFTWTNWNGGTCWLKSGKGSATSLAGAVSAVVSASSPATPATAPSPITATPSTTTRAPSYPSSHVQPRLRSGEIPLRSVNLGGWLVGENWMSLNSTAWTDAGEAATFGEYTTMKQLGKTKGTDQFEQHRATWITETDIQQIAAAGMNAVRVPVGFWIVDEIPGAQSTDISRVYAPGALKYLDMLINDWAVKFNLAVMLSLHAHQGSQNGYDHSAPQVFGAVTWSDSQANVDNSLQFSTLLAARYKDSVAFLGLNLMNEPMHPTNPETVQSYYKEAYTRIRATGNNCVLVTSPPLWNQSPPTMMTFMLAPMYTNVWHEFHVYFRWTLEGNNEAQIMNIASNYRRMNLDPWTGNPLLLGEWSLAGPDSAPFQDKGALKQYAAIQLKNYEGARSGWAFWSWRHDEEATKISGWSLRQLLREGIFTIPRVN